MGELARFKELKLAPIKTDNIAIILILVNPQREKWQKWQSHRLREISGNLTDSEREV